MGTSTRAGPSSAASAERGSRSPDADLVAQPRAARERVVGGEVGVGGRGVGEPDLAALEVVDRHRGSGRQVPGHRPDRHRVVGGGDEPGPQHDRGGHQDEAEHEAGVAPPRTAGCGSRAARTARVSGWVRARRCRRDASCRYSRLPQATARSDSQPEATGGRVTHMAPERPRFLQLADVAEILNISGAQAYALVRRGELKAVKIGGRGQWRVEDSELEAYIQRAYADADRVHRRAPVRRGPRLTLARRPHSCSCRAVTACSGTTCTLRPLALSDVQLHEVLADPAHTPLDLLVVDEPDQARGGVVGQAAQQRPDGQPVHDRPGLLAVGAVRRARSRRSTPSQRTIHSAPRSTSSSQSGPHRASRPESWCPPTSRTRTSLTL